MAPAKSSSRVHIILAPGFCGFDALGQLAYYSGITPLFREWQGARTSRTAAATVALHYFDVLPTASVATRAARLQSYVAKRFARGEFRADDTVALVGHSTGGLDIRRLILDLDARGDQPILVDGPSGATFTVRPADLLGLVRRLVFLSVPQWGTNIADWVRSYRLESTAIVAQLRGSVLAAQVSVFDKIEAWLAASAAKYARADLLLAVQDALAEINVSQAKDPTGIAAALEASAELSLWLRYMAYDFSAIDDLASQPAPNSKSPAHAGPDERERETKLWTRLDIETRSFATVGARPFVFAEGARASRWDLLKPSTYPDALPHTGAAKAMDFLYRYAYRACAGGPFTVPGSGTTPKATRFGASGQRTVEVWDNDGIVNTASMLWPNAEQTLLVDGDHGDIIGHYRLVGATPPSRRKYHTYDLLRSASLFDADTMHAVWTDVFDFCASGRARRTLRDREP